MRRPNYPLIIGIAFYYGSHEPPDSYSVRAHTGVHILIVVVLEHQSHVPGIDIPHLEDITQLHYSDLL